MALSLEEINGLRMVRSNSKLKNYNAFLDFKTEMEAMLKHILQDEKILRIYFVQAFPMTSYVLGYLFKLKNIDKIHIEIIVDDGRLFDFFDEVDMVDEFHIKIMEA